MPTMAYLIRDDIPFHYALVDAFTICDAYHCSLLGPTDPNRLHLWTGWVGNDGQDGGPALDNDGTDFSWPTYPEQLQAAGVSWKVYQDIGFGLNAANYFGWAVANPLAGNFADNPLALFSQYQTAAAGAPLNTNALTGTDVVNGGGLFDQFAADVANNALPQVSWIVAPEAFSEHPNWPANYGAYYVSQILDALTANPAVWSKTVLFLCYDENDGFFDHMVPPTPPASPAQGLCTPDADPTLELFAGNSSYAAGPIGLGVRVPMLVISPWSKGGYVNSQVFDHTSVLQFIARRFGTGSNGLTPANITPWRRVVTGDLTSAFNFATPNAKIVTLPDTSAYLPPNGMRQASYIPSPPATQVMAQQEAGQRKARALPYQLNVSINVFTAAATGKPFVSCVFENQGNAGAVFQLRDGSFSAPPRNYTVGPLQQITDRWNESAGQYDLSIYGPNGFFRGVTGGLAADSANLHVGSAYMVKKRALRMAIGNKGNATLTVTATNRYTGQTVTRVLPPNKTFPTVWNLASSSGWYDVGITVAEDATHTQRLSGHIENGADSLTDPGIGG